MTNDDVIYRSRLRLLALAEEMGSVRAACRMLGVHHSTYYRWRRLLLRYGPELLRPRGASTSADAHRPLADGRAADPGHGDCLSRLGPNRISLELGRPKWGGIKVSGNGVWRLLRGHGLRVGVGNAPVGALGVPPGLGLKQAVAQVFVGATWQRCRVHFMRNALATVPKVAQQMVAATLRSVYVQPDQASAHETIERICRLFEKRYLQLVKVVQVAEVDVLAFYSFPLEHRRQIWSTNSLERLNKEVSRRCDVVGIFPNRSSLLRLVGAGLEEQNDEWVVGRRYFSTESMNKLLQPSNEEVVKALLELESA